MFEWNHLAWIRDLSGNSLIVVPHGALDDLKLLEILCVLLSFTCYHAMSNKVVVQCSIAISLAMHYARSGRGGTFRLSRLCECGSCLRADMFVAHCDLIARAILRNVS